ncbi:hypothetical protein TOPH_08327 [Tolypocladium ophioglossoides CBS 100239]|uniref:Uncharacterized protein n=1 Tax=Tolypocladium ophioglossoides (strain CBS 100239) TaxID=1163406 RepID=A0A0L0MZ17_TOLOC|nr:hypothetical protein TOPH_08327 [Tolypocladium ophioglossoides CBS 100239]
MDSPNSTVTRSPSPVTTAASSNSTEASHTALLGPCPRHEMLHHLPNHREHTYFRSVLRQYCPDVSNLINIAPLAIREAEDCCNKSVPIYVLLWANVPEATLAVPGIYVIRPLINIVLHNYLYRKWFRPYRSEIEWGSFFAKVMQPRDFEMGFEPHEIADRVAAMSASLCTQVDVTQRRMREIDSLDETERQRTIRELEVVNFHNQDFFVLQALFRAVAIVICIEDYFTAAGTLPEIAQTPVFIVLTGIEDGLSAPILFDAIADKVEVYHFGETSKAARTSLGTAVDFLMGLEVRETLAGGLKPSEAPSAEDYRDCFLRHEGSLLTEASKLGWVGELPTGASSRWVDVERYLEWSGLGAELDAGCMQRLEDLQWRALRNAEREGAEIKPRRRKRVTLSYAKALKYI